MMIEDKRLTYHYYDRQNGSADYTFLGHRGMFLRKFDLRQRTDNLDPEDDIISDIKQYLDFNRNMIDVGACYGIYTIELPYNHIYAFEPNKESRYILQTNLLLRGLVDRVDVYDCIVSNFNGTLDFNGYEVKSEFYNTFDNDVIYHYGNYQYKTQQCMKMDDIEMKDIDFIKIDVERHEYEVLCGAVNLLKEYHPKLLIELNVDTVTYNDTINLLVELGYKLEKEYINCNKLFI